MKKLVGFFRLMRPANIVTAVSDILAGATLAGFASGVEGAYSLPLLVLSTVGLYGGGVVFNDVFDAALDRVERPERPIASGLITVKEGAVLGIILLVVGIGAAMVCSFYPPGCIALAIAVAALVYDKWGKHHKFLGPLNMGLCRGLNLLLGISFVPSALAKYGYLALVPILYIGAITMISQGEVHGGKRRTILLAAVLYTAVVATIVYFSVTLGNLNMLLFFIAAFIAFIFPPLLKAYREPAGKNIGKAVKAGVLGLILMNASWAAAFGGFTQALIILLLLPISVLLARLFAVT